MDQSSWRAPVWDWAFRQDDCFDQGQAEKKRNYSRGGKIYYKASVRLSALSEFGGNQELVIRDGKYRHVLYPEKWKKTLPATLPA